MSQYEVAKLLYESDEPLSKKELATEIGVQPATVGDTLRNLRRKDYAKRVAQDQFVFHPSATEDDLKKMEPMIL